MSKVQEPENLGVNKVYFQGIYIYKYIYVRICII